MSNTQKINKERKKIKEYSTPTVLLEFLWSLLSKKIIEGKKKKSDP